MFFATDLLRSLFSILFAKSKGDNERNREISLPDFLSQKSKKTRQRWVGLEFLKKGLYRCLRGTQEPIREDSSFLSEKGLIIGKNHLMDCK